MQSKALHPFIPFLANVSFTLPEACPLKSYENRGIKKEVFVENGLIRKEKLNIIS